jgi:AcrR family transcriptional regulator
MVRRIIQRLGKDQRKESIIKTAIKLFAENGFDAVSMRMIAKEEGISEVILYRYFRNKYKILESILEIYVPIITNSFKEFLDSIDAMVTDLTKSLPLIGQMYLSRIQQFPYFMMFLTKEGDRIPVLLSQADKKYEDEFNFAAYRKILYDELKLLDVFVNYFKRCKEDGFLREDLEPEDCATTVLSIFLPFVIRSPLFPLVKPLTEGEWKDVVSKQIRIILYAFLPNDKQK